MADTKSSGLSIQVDVSEGLKGLKALQREAKKTMHILQDLGNLSSDAGKFSWDLSGREGLTDYINSQLDNCKINFVKREFLNSTLKNLYSERDIIICTYTDREVQNRPDYIKCTHQIELIEKLLLEQ